MDETADPERARLVRRLTGLGMTVEAATAAVDDDRVALVVVDHLIGGARIHSREEAAAQAGLDPEVARTIDRMAGLEEGARYSDGSIRHLALIARLLEVLPAELVLDQIRADIPTLRALAMRTLGTVEGLLVDAVAMHEDPVEAGQRIAAVAGPLLDASSELIGESFRRVVLHLITSDLVVQALRGPSETVDLAVGFIDVVGYTSLSARVDPRGLGEVLARFEATCQEMVERHPAVTLVKFLGDAAMLVCLDPVELARALLEAVAGWSDDVDGQEHIPVSAGMAAGPALLRGGDYFGAPVNEAARLTDLARQHSLLASDRLADVLEPHFTLRRLAPVGLHGIGRRRPYAVRPPSP